MAVLLVSFVTGMPSSVVRVAVSLVSEAVGGDGVLVVVPLDSLAVLIESQGVFTRRLGVGPSSTEEDHRESRLQHKLHIAGFVCEAFPVAAKIRLK